MDYSLPGSSVHGILQTIILEWVSIPFSRGSSWPRNQTWVSCIAGGFFAMWAIRETQPTVIPIVIYIRKETELSSVQWQLKKGEVLVSSELVKDGHSVPLRRTMILKMLAIWPEICKKSSHSLHSRLPSPRGVDGWWLALLEWKPSGLEGTPSPKICLKLPLFLKALAMTFRELKYAQPGHCWNCYNLTFWVNNLS